MPPEEMERRLLIERLIEKLVHINDYSLLCLLFDTVCGTPQDPIERAG